MSLSQSTVSECQTDLESTWDYWWRNSKQPTLE